MDLDSDSVVLVRDVEHQTVLPDQVSDLEASEWEVHLELPALGLEQMAEAAAMSQQAPQDLPGALGQDPAFSGMARKPATTKYNQVMVLHSILAMVWATYMVATARMAPMFRTAYTFIHLDLEVVTAWEAQVPLVLLDLVLSYLWRWEAERHPALSVGLAQAQVAPAAALLLLRGLKLKKDSINK